MGLPVVTFDTPVSREYLGDIGIYARFGSVEDLADKLMLALRERAWAKQLGQQGRDRAVRELSSDRAGPEIEAIYAAALRRYGRLSGEAANPAAAGPQADEREQAVERGA